MNWTENVDTYLSQRRQLGYKLVSEGRYLHNFAVYADQQGATLPLSISLVLAWARLAPSSSDIAMARRTSVLRPFSRYLSTVDPTSGILPNRLLGPTHRRLPPYIFSHEEVSGLMNACDSLFSNVGLRPCTMSTLIGLLASTGLRPGEAVRLDQKEIDLQKGLLTINDSKNWKHRIVPLSKSTIAALSSYHQLRYRRVPSGTSHAFFIMDNGRSLNIDSADHAFQILRGQQGLSKQLNGCYPRLYDLRHTFVCNRLFSWYESGEDVDNLMPQLSRYIGHKKVTDTYWYIQSVPALMNLASHRFEIHQQRVGGDR